MSLVKQIFFFGSQLLEMEARKDFKSKVAEWSCIEQLEEGCFGFMEKQFQCSGNHCLSFKHLTSFDIIPLSGFFLPFCDFDWHLPEEFSGLVPLKKYKWIRWKLMQLALLSYEATVGFFEYDSHQLSADTYGCYSRNYSLRIVYCGVWRTELEKGRRVKQLTR